MGCVVPDARLGDFRAGCGVACVTVCVMRYNLRSCFRQVCLQVSPCMYEQMQMMSIKTLCYGMVGGYLAAFLFLKS